MKKQQPKHKALINFIYLALFILIVAWIVFLGDNSFYRRWLLGQKVRRTEAQMKAVQAQNDSLKQENNRLKTDPAEQRRFLRAKYGIYDEDETAYIFKPAQGDSLKGAP